ncbi:nesprin-3 isoform X2 [Kryptolebias marmoratus]|uniref:nesprin-3 isoform X2 n=1 Tax=Kryptolebias marmoratus TaxID=37003 RepID=UPI0007F89FD9|nr:nesprin-3 isoform X2 [Kryptolebias marmoratus]
MQRFHSEGSGAVMTQQELQEFSDCLEAALAWMQAVQERLRANDNTQGPRDALEARLRETEKIHQSAHEGQVKMDQVLAAAENLLQSGDEELKSSTNVKLKELKSLWEETSTHIIHCHSRIEWVWLHWSEYLKAYEEFQLWLLKQRCGLDTDVELQLGPKEKLWQVDQQEVALSDIQSQVALLERLLDEAAALHSRTQDSSMNPQAQQKLQEDYDNVRDRAKERLSLLRKISDEHQMFNSCAQKFQFWLLSKTKELTELMNGDDTAEDKLRALKTLDDSVACEEKTLQHIEGVADAVRANTSPAGAEAVQEEAEELRLGWQRLRQGLCEAEDGLRCRLDSQSQYLTRCQKLGENIRRLREMLEGVDQELEETQDSGNCLETTEEQMVGQWKKYSVVRKTLAGEESQVEQLKSQLKDLFRFSEDSHHLSDDVLAVVKEHQSVKCRANRLCSESELELRSVLQDPLLLFSQWSLSVSQVMEASSNVADFANISVLLQKIQCLLKDSAQLQERLSLLQVKGDLLDSVFGPEKSNGLQEELSTVVRRRELLHGQLLQRKCRLEGLVSRTKDFDEAYKLILSKLMVFRDRLQAADVLQPDIVAKKSQLDQLVVLQKELEDDEAQLTALETLVSSGQSSRTPYEKLCADWTELQRRVTLKVQEAEDTVSDHERFQGNLLNMEKWMMVMRQKLESFHGSLGGWSVEGRRPEAQRALAEFPEKELQVHQMDVQVQKVLNRTSRDGQVHILKDTERLKELWVSLCDLSLNLQGLLDGSTETDSGSAVRRGRLETQHPPPLVTVGTFGSIGQDVDGSGIRSSYGSAGAEVTARSGGEDGSRGSTGPDWARFKAWLSGENEVLSEILKTDWAELGTKEVQSRQKTLQGLRSRVSEGQQMFQMLLQETPDDDEGLEEVRYRWLLYKSKLRDIGTRARTVRKEVGPKPTLQKKPGLLQRICRLALLLWLLLLALLLLAFLLPLMDEGNSCSLSNNFARSFSVMLRYDGPPPT